MKRIMEDILKAEDGASSILAQARERASQIRQSAEKEISENMNQARRQAAEIRQAAIEEARKEAERIREEKLSKAQQQERSLLNDDAGRIGPLVDRICEVILKTDYAKDKQ